jgi:anti-sigma factor RsiW
MDGGGARMSCTELLRTQAFLDGELDDKAAAEVEGHIETCPECQAFSSDTAGLSDAIRRGLAHYHAPASLRKHIGEALDAEIGSQQIVSLHPRRRSFWFGAASGVGVSALAAAFALLTLLPPSAATLAEAVTDAHTQALMRGQVIQVASSNHHTVKPWFAGRVPVSPLVVDFAQQGFPLLGGRIDEVAGSRAAVVAYRHGKHEIDLFVWADKGSRLPGQSTAHGYHSIFWKSGDLDFAAVSDTDRTELTKFVSLVRSQPE